jgi:hypothetical protein
MTRTNEQPATLDEALQAIALLRANNAALVAEKRDAEAKAKDAGNAKGTLEQRLALLESEINTQRTARERAEKESYSARVREKLDPVARAANMHPGALDDVMARLNSTAELSPDGFVDRSTGKPLVLRDWVEGLRESASHFWPASQGGGATGSGGGGSPIAPVTVDQLRQPGGLDAYAKAKQQLGADKALRTA